MNFYTTDEAAEVLKRRSSSLRAYYQRAGQAYGVRPIKVGARLHWPANQIRRVARGLPATLKTGVAE